MSKQKSALPENTFHSYDAFFFIAFCMLITEFICMAQRGIGMPDEAFYVTIPHRLMQGDKLIIDDWHVSQFSSFMQYIPVKLFYDYVGSFDGVILYLRYLYVIFQGITILILYPFFRKYKWRGVIALSIFGAYIPITLESLNYYTLCLWPAATVCTVLHFTDSKKKVKGITLFVMGVLTALCVLAEPLTACCFFIYSFTVFLKYFLNKKHPQFLESYDYFINFRYWRYITIGIISVATAFLIFLFRGGDPLTTIKSIPYLFGGYEYDFSPVGGNVFTPKVLFDCIDFYGTVPVICMGFITLMALITQKYRKTVRPFLTAAILVVFVIQTFNSYKTGHYDVLSLFYGVPLYFAGPVLFLMTEKRDKRIWAFWCSGAFLSFFLDISSAIVIGVCGVISSAASAIFLFDLLCEYKEQFTPCAEKTFHKVSRASGLVLSAVLITTILGNEICWNMTRLHVSVTENFFAAEVQDNHDSRTLNTKLEKGPYMGIKTTEDIALKYNMLLCDLDCIASKTDSPVMVNALFPYFYLYLDKPYGTFSTWFVSKEAYRLIYYYNIHPERIPEYVYLPKYDPYSYCQYKDMKSKTDSLQEIFDCEMTEGKAGYIVKINSLNTLRTHRSNLNKGG